MQKLFEDKIKPLQTSGGNIILPSGSRVTIGGQQYSNSSNTTVTTDTTNPSSRYQVYATVSGGAIQLVTSQNENSVGPVGYSSWKLVGVYYTSITSTFLQFGDIKLPEYESITEVVDASGSGDISTGSLRVSRNKNIINVSNDGAVLNHANQTFASTAAGFLPPWATPDIGYSNVPQVSASQLFRTFVTSLGEVVQEYRSYGGGGSNRTNSSAFIVTYPLSEAQTSNTPIEDL